MVGKVNHRLQELLTEKEKVIGRKSLAYHAKAMGVSKRSLERWLDKDNPTKRFDKDMIEKFCHYFSVDVGDILVYQPADNEGTQDE